MDLNFPVNPSPGQIYVGTNGVTYVYDNGKWRGDTVANITGQTDRLVAGAYNVALGTNGVVTLPYGGSIVSYDTGAVDLAAAIGVDSYIGMTYNYRNWMWVDTAGAYIQASDGDTIKTWTFGNTGILTIPLGGDIVDSSGNSVLGGTGGVSDTFKTLVIDGQDSLVADGNDTVEIVAGIGVTLTTNNTAPKSLTISADSLVNLDGGSAGTVYDTPVVYADGGGASTRFGVNSTTFDGEDVDPGTIDFNLNGGKA